MTRPPSVALFPSSYWPHLGGVEELTRRLATELATRGAPPLVLTNRYPTDLPRRERLDDIEIVRERFSVPLPSWRPLAGFAMHAGATRRRIRGALDRFDPEVLHVQCVSFQSRYVLAERRRTGLPLVVSLHGELTMDASQVYQRTPLLRRLWTELLDEADVVTACSSYVLAETQDAYDGDLGSRARVVPNGVLLPDPAAVRPYSHDSPYILGVGRLVPQKGFDLLVAAFARLSDRHAGVDLLLVGEGPERAALLELVGRTGLTGRVHLMGGRNHDDVLELFRGARAFVLPSRHEPQGMVVLEAMSLGVPVVAAEVGGVPEVVDGRNGLLFHAGDVPSLIEKLEGVLGDPEAAASRAVTASGRVQSHSWEKVTDAYQACYDDACMMRRN